MARFKLVHKGLKFLPVDFDRQVLPGSFEFALSRKRGRYPLLLDLVTQLGSGTESRIQNR